MSLFNEIKNCDPRQPALWSKKLRVIVVVLILHSVLITGYFVSVKAKLLRLNLLQNTEFDLKAEYRQQKIIALHLQDYRKQKTNAEHTFDLLIKKLPDASEIPDLLVSMTQAGRTRQLSFSQIKPDSVIEKDFYAEKPIHISAQGNYHQIASFVSDLALLPRIVSVHDLLLNRQNDKQLQVELKTSTYHYLAQHTIVGSKDD